MEISAIDQKIKETRIKIVDLHPNSCTSCSGRGGRVYPSWEGCYDIELCDHCVLKGLDPLDMTKELLPYQYDEELLQEWREEDDYDPYDLTNMGELEIQNYYKRCTSPTQGEEILHGEWNGLSAFVQNLLDLKEELSQVQKRYENLVLSEDIK